ncbi:uncharacterized protein [Primulina eburnea]|uniref:uncharacterized protein n=1 Tax=Primulina eburnea TaxID=1245227 RepID=UPI003C6C00F7
MSPRRAPSTDKQADNVEDRHVNAPSPPNGDVAMRELEGMARFFEQQFQQAPRTQHDIYDQFQRLGPKEFSGTTDSFADEAWIRAFEAHFRYLNMWDDDHVRCATYMFRNDASLWWEEAEHDINLATLTWDRFKEMFYEKYFIANVRGRLKREFMTLRRGETFVAEFVRKFDRGCHFVPLIARDVAENLRHFLDGLQTTIHHDVMMMCPLDYDTATAYSFQAEQALKDIDFEVQRKRQQHQQHSQPNKKSYMGPHRPQGQQKPQCQVKNPGSPKPPQPGAPKPAARYFICKEEGNKAADCPKKNAPTVGRAYVMHVEEAEEEPDTALITDSGATHSFIFETFVKRLNIIPEDMVLGLKVSIPSVDQMITSSIVKNLEFRLYKDVVRVDLIVLPMPKFDFILPMDWLSTNGASIDFGQRSVSIRPPSGKFFVFEEAWNKQMPHVISCLCARKLMRRGCQAFLACVNITHAPISQKLEDVETVRDFPSVFPDDVSDIPPDHEIKEEHSRHLKTTLQVLQDRMLFAKISKCEFWPDRVAFLGHIISSDG